MAKFPEEPKTGKPISALSDDELHQAYKDFTAFADQLGRIASRVKMRSRSIQSVIHKRAHKRSTGSAVQPSDKTRLPRAERPKEFSDDLVMSDHAIVRFLSRVKGMDIQAVRAEMAERMRAGESYFGGAVIIDTEGFTYLRRPDGFIKTVIPHDWLTEEDLDLNASKYEEFGHATAISDGDERKDKCREARVPNRSDSRLR